MSEPPSSNPVVLLNEVFPGDTNALDTLFGGRLMAIMDTAAGMAASQYAHNVFVTVSVVVACGGLLTFGMAEPRLDEHLAESSPVSPGSTVE